MSDNDTRHYRTASAASGGSATAAPSAGSAPADRLSDLLQGIDAIVWEMEIDSCRYTFVSERALEILGHPVRTWLEHPDFNRIMVHPDDYERVAREGRTATAEGRSHRIEYRAVTADGNVVWLRDWIRVIPGAGGRPGLLRGVTVDVTERKEAERALHDSEERLSQIAGAIEDVVYMDEVATGRYLYVSPAYERVWGMSRDSLYADKDAWFDAVHPDDRPRLVESMRRLAAGGYEGEWREEYRLVRADGAVRWVWDVSAPVRDTTGRIVRMVGCTRDITARKEAEAAVREREESFRQIMGAIRDNVYMEDVRRGCFIYVSPAYEEIWGLSTESLYHDYRAWIDAIHPEDRWRIQASLEDLAAGGYRQDWRQEYRVVRPDGSVRWVWDNAVPIADETGTVHRMVGSARDITERKQSEAALREAQERYEIVRRATMDAVWDWDMRSDGVYWNEGLTSLFGYAPGDARAGATWWIENIHPADRERIVRSLEETVSGAGNTWSGEYRFRRADGTHAHVLDRGYVIRDEHEHAIRMIGSMQDVTARREVEEALRESQQRYEIVSRATNDAVWDWDLRTSTVRWNHGIQTVFGYREDQVGREAAWGDAMIHEEDRARIVSALDAVTRGRNTLWTGEYRFRRADGTYAHVMDRSFLIHDEEGRAVRMIGSMLDITERKVAEEALRQAETKYRALFENALTGIFQTTPDGRVLTANPAMARILGYRTPEELVGSVHDVRAQLYADPGQRDALLRRLEERGAVENFEAQVVRRDGEMIWVSADIRAGRDADGRLTVIEGVFQEITERRRAEEALRQISGHLLRSQDQERRRIARELHDGTAQVLAALGMNLEALRKAAGGLPAGARAKLSGSQKLLEQCVQEVRTLSYLLHPPLLDEAGLTAAIRSYARGFAERSGIRVDVRLPRAAARLPEEVELTLFRIVQESLSNIHRHSGSAVAHIGMARENGRVRLEVRDRGRGLGTAHARASTSGPKTAIGVGIAGMRERVRQLGGDLAIKSSARGTIVKVVLPVGHAG